MRRQALPHSPANLLYIVVSSTGIPGHRTASAVREKFNTPLVRASQISLAAS
jgi:hypothetical protein